LTVSKRGCGYVVLHPRLALKLHPRFGPTAFHEKAAVAALRLLSA